MIPFGILKGHAALWDIEGSWLGHIINIIDFIYNMFNLMARASYSSLGGHGFELS